MNISNSPTKSVLRTDRKNSYFASANGFYGFRSLYDEIYRSEDFARVFVIKGGPGTGKSRFMAEVAEACESAGAIGEYFYCSSDPASLDGVILEKNGIRIALTDGTAPHERDAKVPGAIDEIINLGDFWREDALTKKRQQILHLCREKAKLFCNAYRYLRIAGELDALREETVADCIDEAKLARAADRELRLLKISRHPQNDRRYLSAFGMSGEVRLNTLPEGADIVSVTSPYGTARFYLRALLRVLRTEGVYSYRLFPSCYSDSIPEGVYLPQNNILFLEESEECAKRTVNMKRFLFGESVAARRSELRLLDAERARMLCTAEGVLRSARETHLALESVYGAAMNFPAKEAFTAGTVQRVLSLFSPQGG